MARGVGLDHQFVRLSADALDATSGSGQRRRAAETILMSMTTRFWIHPIPSTTLDQVRSTGVDVSNAPIVRLTAEGGEPLRCCLRNARPGERLILLGYEPPIGSSPYREIGPVFACAERCEGPEHVDRYPTQWRGKRQVLRSYDRRGWIHDALIHDGNDPEAVITRLLSSTAAVQLHSRNVAYGCFMFAVTRD
jgi:hypothetical protein